MSSELATIDHVTGEIIEAPNGSPELPQPLDIYHGASELTLTADESRALLAPFPDEAIAVRPHDNLLYVPQSYIRERLNQVIGVGQWAIIQQAVHKDAANLYFDGCLYVRGRFVARAMGESKYIASNPKSSWASAYESAKSDCITRCCKDLGIAADLWKPAFADGWRERTGKPRQNTRQNAQESRSATNQRTAKDSIIAGLHAKYSHDLLHDHAAHMGMKSLADCTPEQLRTIDTHLDTPGTCGICAKHSTQAQSTDNTPDPDDPFDRDDTPAPQPLYADIDNMTYDALAEAVAEHAQREGVDLRYEQIRTNLGLSDTFDLTKALNCTARDRKAPNFDTVVVSLRELLAWIRGGTA